MCTTYIIACLIVGDAATDLSMAWWVVDKADCDKLKAVRRASGKYSPEEADNPPWKEIKEHCKRYVRPRQEHAQCLEDVKRRWENRTDWSGRKLWTAAATKALDGVIKEVLAGLYEGIILVNAMHQLLKVLQCTYNSISRHL
jgi:hypothetical protein